MILVSQCLTGDCCRWDGGSNLVPELKALAESGLAVTACPEVLGGLPIPRKPSEILDLKAKSPSCGCGLVHNGKFDGGLVVGNGITAQLLLDRGYRVMTETEYLISVGQLDAGT